MFFHILDDQNRRQKVFVDVFLPQTRLDFLNTGLLYINIGISCLFWPLTITISPTLRSQSPSILYSLHKISNKITISNHTTKAKRRKKKKKALNIEIRSQITWPQMKLLERRGSVRLRWPNCEELAKGQAFLATTSKKSMAGESSLETCVREGFRVGGQCEGRFAWWRPAAV